MAQGALESASDSLHARAEWASTCCGVSGDANPVSRQRVAVPRLLPRAGGGHERERTSPLGVCVVGRTMQDRRPLGRIEQRFMFVVPAHAEVDVLTGTEHLDDLPLFGGVSRQPLRSEE